jgi:hypothetical protein
VKRWAVVHDQEEDTLKSIRDLLPANYMIVHVSQNGEGVLIAGEDDHGWTMDDYVIPRLGSGLIAAREVFPCFVSEKSTGMGVEMEIDIPKEWLQRGVPLEVLT